MDLPYGTKVLQSRCKIVWTRLLCFSFLFQSNTLAHMCLNGLQTYRPKVDELSVHERQLAMAGLSYTRSIWSSVPVLRAWGSLSLAGGALAGLVPLPGHVHPVMPRMSSYRPVSHVTSSYLLLQVLNNVPYMREVMVLMLACGDVVSFNRSKSQSRPYTRIMMA